MDFNLQPFLATAATIEHKLVKLMWLDRVLKMQLGALAQRKLYDVERGNTEAWQQRFDDCTSVLAEVAVLLEQLAPFPDELIFW